jgi:hypothetical protein
MNSRRYVLAPSGSRRTGNRTRHALTRALNAAAVAGATTGLFERAEAPGTAPVSRAGVGPSPDTTARAAPAAD